MTSTRLRNTGNRMLTWLANAVLHSDYSDLCYGYIALRRECVEILELQSDGFEIETELIVRASRAGLRIAEVPSHELCRISGKSNLHTFRDGWRVLRTLARERIAGRPPPPAPGPKPCGGSNTSIRASCSRTSPRIPRVFWECGREPEMSPTAGFPTISVVICSYTEERWDRLMGALDSVRAQTHPPQQTIVVVDYNMDLYKRLIFTVPGRGDRGKHRAQRSLRRAQHRGRGGEG